MTDELDLLDDGTDIVYKGKRPAFLQVLCILTFVGTGVGLIWSFFSVVAISAMERMMDGLSNLAPDPGDFSDQMENAYRWMKWSLYASIIGNLLCLTGAIFMWSMKKRGYYIYVAGQGLPLIIGIVAFISSYGYADVGGGLATSFGLIGLIAQTIFPVGFIIMYGLNFKYLK